jgi:hypothetical protein
MTEPSAETIICGIEHKRRRHAFTRVVITPASLDTEIRLVPSTSARIVNGDQLVRATMLTMALLRTPLMLLTAGVISATVAFAGVTNSVRVASVRAYRARYEGMGPTELLDEGCNLGGGVGNDLCNGRQLSTADCDSGDRDSQGREDSEDNGGNSGEGLEREHLVQRKTKLMCAREMSGF